MIAKPKNVSEVDAEAYYRFIEEFAKESDRAAVVLGAAKLDQQLYQILQRALLPSSNSSDELMDGDAPLSTFNARTYMAFRLGLIDRDLARTLHLIRRIRNSFAHEISGSTLDGGTHRDRIKELVGPFIGNINYDAFKNFHIEKWRDFKGPPLEFRVVLAIVAGRLESLYHNVERCHATSPWPLIPNHWQPKQKAT